MRVIESRTKVGNDVMHISRIVISDVRGELEGLISNNNNQFTLSCMHCIYDGCNLVDLAITVDHLENKSLLLSHFFG